MFGMKPSVFHSKPAYLRKNTANATRYNQSSPKGCLLAIFSQLLIIACIIAIIVSPFVFFYAKGKEIFSTLSQNDQTEKKEKSTQTQNLIREETDQAINENVVHKTEYEKWKGLLEVGEKKTKEVIKEFNSILNTPEERQMFLEKLSKDEEVEKQERKVFIDYICNTYDFSNWDEVYELIEYGEDVVDYLYSFSTDIELWEGIYMLDKEIIVFSMEEIWRGNSRYFEKMDLGPHDYAYVVKKKNNYYVLAVTNIGAEMQFVEEKLNIEDFRNIVTERIEKMEKFLTRTRNRY